MAEISISKYRGRLMAVLAVMTMVVAAFGVCAILDNGSDAASTHKVSFVTGEGATPIADITDVADGAILFYVLEGIADPVKEGYQFMGWYHKDLKTKYAEGLKVTKDLTLYAKWFNPETQVTVTFLADSQYPDVGLMNGQIITLVVDKDSTVSAPKIAPVNGYAFVGWYTFNSVTGEAEKFDFGTKITETTMLYALWEEISGDTIIDILVNNIVSIVAFIAMIALAVAYYFVRNPVLLIIIILLLIFAPMINNLVSGGSGTY